MIRVLVVVLLACVAFGARAALPIASWKTSSGSHAFFVEVRSLPMLDISVEFAAGSAYDAPGTEGASRLAHALLREGTQSSSAAEIDNRLASVGAQVNPVYDRDRAGYRLRTLSSARERTQATQALAELIQRPAFAADAFERERQRLLSATRQEESRPNSVLLRRLYPAMYGEHPYGRVHTEDSLNKLRREHVSEFYQRHYASAAAVITLVGDVSRDEARAIAEQLAAGLPVGAAPSPLPQAGTSAAVPSLRIRHPSEQSHIAMGLPMLTRSDPDYFALYVGNYILGGGGFVSRLYKGVREERGLAYSVYSVLQPYGARGPLVVGLQTENRQADSALATTRAIVESFVQEGPTEGELRAAKKGIAGGFALRTDSNLKILDEVAALAFYKLPLDWLDTFVAKVQSVTVAEIRAVFRKRVSPERITTVVVGAGS